MSDIDDGGPAFPSEAIVEKYPDGSARRRAIGMSLRDYFAARALEGLLMSPLTYDDLFTDIAAMSYRAADAMIAERKRK